MTKGSEYKSGEYQNGTPERQNEMQQQWLETRTASHQTWKENTQTLTETDQSVGEHHSLKYYADKEGLPAALRYANKCWKLGGDWVQWHPMWEHWGYLEVLTKHKSKFDKAAALRVGGSTAAASSALAALPAPPKAASQELKTEPLANASLGAPGGTPDKPLRKPKPAVTTNHQEAVKVKTAYGDAMSRASSLINIIQNGTDEKLSRFNHDEQIRPLIVARDQLEEKVVKDEWVQKFLLGQPTPKTAFDHETKWSTRRITC